MQERLEEWHYEFESLQTAMVCDSPDGRLEVLIVHIATFLGRLELRVQAWDSILEQEENVSQTCYISRPNHFQEAVDVGKADLFAVSCPQRRSRAGVAAKVVFAFGI